MQLHRTIYSEALIFASTFKQLEDQQEYPSSPCKKKKRREEEDGEGTKHRKHCRNQITFI